MCQFLIHSISVTFPLMHLKKKKKKYTEKYKTHFFLEHKLMMNLFSFRTLNSYFFLYLKENTHILIKCLHAFFFVGLKLKFFFFFKY